MTRIKIGERSKFMAKKRYPGCARCPVEICGNWGKKVSDGPPSLEKTPGFCPMRLMPEVIDEAVLEYDKPDVKEFARLASIQEFECYEHLPEGLRTKIPRVEELIQFARKCGYKRLGIAFCGGLMKEAGMLTDVLESKGFEVVSVMCKAGAVPKERIGIRDDQKITGPGYWETMCSPISQAEIINRSDVDMAIMLGLCIGHDTLFIKYCRVPMTVLAVKDRVFGHNPLAALYLSNSPYYGRLRAKAE
jgi:uncharacterized metal-binding protein